MLFVLSFWRIPTDRTIAMSLFVDWPTRVFFDANSPVLTDVWYPEWFGESIFRPRLQNSAKRRPGCGRRTPNIASKFVAPSLYRVFSYERDYFSSETTEPLVIMRASNPSLTFNLPSANTIPYIIQNTRIGRKIRYQVKLKLVPSQGLWFWLNFVYAGIFDTLSCLEILKLLWTTG